MASQKTASAFAAAESEDSGSRVDAGGVIRMLDIELSERGKLVSTGDDDERCWM